MSLAYLCSNIKAAGFISWRWSLLEGSKIAPRVCIFVLDVDNIVIGDDLLDEGDEIAKSFLFILSELCFVCVLTYLECLGSDSVEEKVVVRYIKYRFDRCVR